MCWLLLLTSATTYACIRLRLLQKFWQKVFSFCKSQLYINSLTLHSADDCVPNTHKQQPQNVSPNRQNEKLNAEQKSRRQKVGTIFNFTFRTNNNIYFSTFHFDFLSQTFKIISGRPKRSRQLAKRFDITQHLTNLFVTHRRKNLKTFFNQPRHHTIFEANVQKSFDKLSCNATKQEFEKTVQSRIDIKLNQKAET